ncbi:MAG: hypothetical protein J7L83_00075 [Thaumarchaeota archaeon]|nr:hypothetical protein [Nitrososphaerota archaeon]
MSDDEFEVIVVESPKIEVDIPRDKLLSFINLAEELGWEKSKIKRYINTALRLRKLEREAGRSYISLLREYRKLSSEEVKLRYSIEQLKEKRKQIEDDLNLYLEQHKLTLDLVGRIAKIADALRERGLELEDLEKAMNVIESMKSMDHDVAKIIKSLEKQRSLRGEIRKLEEKIKSIKEEIGGLEEEKEKLLNELREIHGLSGEISQLKEKKREFEEEVQKAEEQVKEAQARLEAAKAELEQLLGHKATIEELRELIQQLRESVERLKSEKDRLGKELSELLEVRGEIDEIRNKIEEDRRKLEELEREVSNRQAYLEVLEGEISAAYTILKIFTDPQGVEAEDLETLADQLEKITKIKRGELSALKPLEPHLLNRTRESIISLILPYVKNEFVPKKAFEQLEREIKRLKEKNIALEEEAASLRRALEAKAEKKTEPTLRPLIKAVTPSGETVELKSLEKGMKVKITCPSCKNSTITNIPTREELEELNSKDYKLRFTCKECGKSFDIPISMLLKKMEG